MSRDPLPPKYPADPAACRTTSLGNDAPLPDVKPSTASDIAAFVAKAREMSPYAAGSRPG
jgi:hypothetical protein